MQLDTLSPRADSRDRYHVIIETPRGSRNKYSYDAEGGVFVLKKILPEAHVFPFDFGFFPRTRAADGDPLDALVLMDEPAFPGCRVECRVIGVVRARQRKRGRTLRNDRFIAVAETSRHFKRVQDLRDLDREVIAQLRHFFVSYIQGAGGEITLEQTRGARAARSQLEKAIASGPE